MRTLIGGLLFLALPLSGCSDDPTRRLAECKVRAIELYRPPAIETQWANEPLSYVHNCMLAAGYRLEETFSHCVGIADVTSASCWYQNTWLQRLLRAL